MKRLLLLIPLLLSLSIPTRAQQGNMVLINFPGAPSGSCSPISFAKNAATGAFYDCVAGVWTLVGSGGGITGTLTATRIPFASGASTLTDSANMTYSSGLMTLAGSGGSVLGTPTTLHINTTDSNSYGFVFTEATDTGSQAITMYIEESVLPSGGAYLGLGNDFETFYSMLNAEGGHSVNSLHIEPLAAAGEVVFGWGSGAQAISPDTDNVQNIGTSSFRWGSLHVGTGASRIDGALTLGSTLAGATSTSSASYLTATNCADSAGAAACGSAAAGAFVIDATTTATVVSTTAVTANSEIFLEEDSSLGTRLGVTCNTQSILVLGTPVVTARTAATSFTATIVTGPTTNPMCLTYHIIN